MEWDLGFGIWDGIWGWDGNGIWDLGWDGMGLGFGTNGNWDSPIPNIMGGKYNPYCADTKYDMLKILKVNTKEEVQQIFKQIKMRNEDGIDSKYIYLLVYFN